MFKLVSKLNKSVITTALVALLFVISGIGLQLQALGSNVVANPSVETADTTNTALPASWLKDKWGTNTATLSYSSDAHSGTKGLTVNMTKRTNGDAKWYFIPVTVKPSTSYTFSDWSKSNVNTSIVAMYTSTTGAVTYVDLASSVAAHSTWFQKSITFNTPANVKTMTVFHLINKVGTLTTDDFSLAETNAAVTMPTVSLTTPGNGSTVSGTVNLTASASNATSVQYKIDNVNLGAPVTTSPYTFAWDTTNIANGSHTISAVATNNNGTATATASVTVNNVAPAPTVNLTAPANNSTISGSVTLAASATNALGVQFKVDGVNVGSEDTSAPYSYTWDSTAVANGTHTVTAVARNVSGSTTSNTATITVSNNAPLPTVAFSAPTANSNVGGSVNVTANTTNAVGVQFKVDGTNIGSEDTISPYGFTWNTTATTNASHTITAIARNSTGQTTTTTVTVTVYNAPAPIATNLIANPSAETADAVNPQMPASWANNKWGTNTTTFSYSSNGHTGNKALTTTITSYTNGDAKWYFSPVPATASTTYQYSDWYQSNVQSSIVVELQSTSGALTYLDLGTIAPSTGTNWNQSNVTFTTKADTASFTVYHLLNSVGALTTDDTSVTKYEAPAADPLAITNSSLETANGAAPTGWTSSKWGTNTTSFQYMNEGHTGTHSVKTTVSAYTDGDAKWFYNPITSLEAGKQYRWTTWYKTNTRPQAVMMFTRADGTEGFFGMPQPFPSADSATVWHQYSETFIVPADAVSVTNFLFINGNGWVQVDDNSLASYVPTGWNRPLVTLTFDDGYEGNVTNALPVLNQYGFKTTQCFETMDLQADPVNGKNNVMAFVNAGHEICSHTITHPYLSTLTTAQVDKELADSKTYLENLIGKSVPNFASPYGDYSQNVNTEIMKYYGSHRTVDEGFNSKDNFDPYRLRVQNMTPTTTLAQVQSWVTQAQADNTWLILVYHRITDTPEAFDTKIADFKAQMAYLSSTGVTVKTMQDALTEVRAQQ